MSHKVFCLTNVAELETSTIVKFVYFYHLNVTQLKEDGMHLNTGWRNHINSPIVLSVPR